MKVLCWEIEYIGWSRQTWKIFAERGEMINAIKALREQKNRPYPCVDDPRRMGLRDAKNTVEAYMAKRGIKWH